jgi:predicted branched-subunit amino acid permease
MSTTPATQPRPVVPRWVAPLFALVGAALVPWTLWLAYDLPGRHIAHHWDVAWAGFDAAMAALLLATAIAALRRSPWIQSTSVAAATMLACDAWFDIMTASRSLELAIAIATAFLVELPLAAICVWVARDVERAQTYFAAAGRLTRRARPR